MTKCSPINIFDIQRRLWVRSPRLPQQQPREAIASLSPENLADHFRAPNDNFAGGGESQPSQREPVIDVLYSSLKTSRLNGFEGRANRVDIRSWESASRGSRYFSTSVLKGPHCTMKEPHDQKAARAPLGGAPYLDEQINELCAQMFMGIGSNACMRSHREGRCITRKAFMERSNPCSVPKKLTIVVALVLTYKLSAREGPGGVQRSVCNRRPTK